jgi:hypothetical protein
MVTLVIVAALAVLRKMPVVVLLVASVTMVALEADTALPYWSCSATVIVAEFTPAVSVCAVVVKANWLAAAALRVFRAKWADSGARRPLRPARDSDSNHGGTETNRPFTAYASTSLLSESCSFAGAQGRVLPRSSATDPSR